jgi:hypothetical protein
MEEVVVMGWAAVTEGVTNPTRAPKIKLEGGKFPPLSLLIFFKPFQYVSKNKKKEKNIPIIRNSKASLESYALGS